MADRNGLRNIRHEALFAKWKRNAPAAGLAIENNEYLYRPLQQLNKGALSYDRCGKEMYFGDKCRRLGSKKISR